MVLKGCVRVEKQVRFKNVVMEIILVPMVHRLVKWHRTESVMVNLN